MLLIIAILVCVTLVVCDAFYDTDEAQKKQEGFEQKLNNRQKM